MANDQRKTSKGIGRFRKVVNSIYHFLVLASYRLALLFAWIIGFNFILRMFIDFKSDTTSLSNGAFAIVASLAALSFSCARSLDEEKVLAKGFNLAGQSLFFAAIIFIMASVLKYSLLSLKQVPWILTQHQLVNVLDFLLGGLAAVLFGVAIAFTSRGLELVLALLEHRVTDVPELKRKFGPWLGEERTPDREFVDTATLADHQPGRNLRYRGMY